MVESRVFVAALEISESKETNLEESVCQGVGIPSWRVPGLQRKRYRFADVSRFRHACLVISEKCA